MSAHERQLIGKRLRAERQARGWTQEQLAREAGFKTKVAVSQVETGSRAGLFTIARLARALGISLDALVTGSSTPRRRRRQ
jgi:transcriptional regulator with XRE-family HTH domain